ncbi:hypothetical protein LLE49_09255 [Alicyclobacillus tolerans]|uniref:CBO0543 family protein n=1 Tax=Alicyclobacillus tolerans TaxID=90970 RepID=UPI001F35ED83|nr:CBO0543 family protein [Alicyclobacillus tolerans]MCF8564905.1 hypothetical protein [Alicyclobacillus tolerans]
MIILIFTLCFLAAFVLTRSYRFLDKYYPTALYVSLVSLLYQLLCRGHLLWHFRNWHLFTDKLSTLIQFAVLFPCSAVLFLRYLPRRKLARTLYFLGFFAVYVVMELCLKLSGEIIYQFGWSLGWSVFIDFCFFAFTWMHARNWKVALPISASIIVFLMAWFRVPLHG